MQEGALDGQTGPGWSCCLEGDKSQGWPRRGPERRWTAKPQEVRRSRQWKAEGANWASRWLHGPLRVESCIQAEFTLLSRDNLGGLAC